MYKHQAWHCSKSVTWRNLIQVDVDVVVPVCAGLFMVKAQSVEELVLNDGLVVAAGAQGQDLTCLLITDAGETSTRQSNRSRYINGQEGLHQSLCF